jgi:hypothetical protein
VIPPNLVKARLEQISWDQDNQVIEVPEAKKIPVQFNPDSLKVSLSNQTSGGDQRGGSAIQFVGAGTTKLSFDLWFDVTSAEHNTHQVNGFIPDDVRLLTQEVAFFITPTPDKKDKKKFVPPGVRFLWGRFLFEGIMESLNEEISYFSEDGRPLRAKISVSLMRQEIQFKVPPQNANQAASTASSGGGGGAGGPGPADPDAPREEAEEGDTVADLAGAAGNPESWPAVAAANGIDNPRSLAPGTVLDVSASAGFSAGASVGVGFSAGASVGASAGASAGVGASAGAGVGFGAGASAGGSLGGGLRAGVAASAGGGAGAGAGAGLGAGASAGIGAGIGGGIGAGAGASFGAGASAGFGAGIGGGASLGVGGGFGAGVGSASLSFEGAAGSASARANATFDLSLRR